MPLVRQASAAVGALALLLSGCGGSESGPPKSDSVGSTAGRNALVGEWQRETTCAELVQALRDAGMEGFVREFVAGNGFIPGIQSADQLADSDDPCKSAVRRVHSHFFTEGGAFGSHDWNGEDVDDGSYRVDADKVVISKEFPDVIFRYRIDGDTITFDPEIPNGCASFRCAWSISVAYPGKSWRRVE